MVSKRPIALLILLLVVASVVSYVAGFKMASAGPGVLFTLRLYEPDPARGRLVEVTHILDDPNVLVTLRVEAITPPGHGWKEDVVAVAETVSRGRRAIFVQSDELLRIARGWVETYASRGGRPEETYSGLIVYIAVRNATSREILFEALDSVSYEPYEMARGVALRVTVHLVKGRAGPAARIEAHHGIVRRYEVGAAGTWGWPWHVQAQAGSCYYYWELAAEVKAGGHSLEVTQRLH